MRFDTPSRSNIFVRWYLTVFELMENCSAMSWFVDPATMADTISSWRAVNPNVGCGAAAPDGIARSRMLSMMFPTHSRPTQVPPGHHRVNALEEQFGRRVLHHDASSAELQRLDDVRVARLGREQQRADRRRQRRQLAKRREPGRHRHAQVEQKNVGPQVRREPDGVPAVAGFANDTHRGIRFEQLAQRFAKQRMVIGNDDGD